MGIVSPFFHEDELVGWGYANQHLVDIGGMSISGMAPTARDVYSEALLFPSIRAVRNGTLDPEWERYITNSVRSPGPVLNDLRSMIAANNVGQRKISHLLERYGQERFLEFSEINKTLSEEALRAKIAKLPDGVYDANDWTEYDGRGAARAVPPRADAHRLGRRAALRLPQRRSAGRCLRQRHEGLGHGSDHDRSPDAVRLRHSSERRDLASDHDRRR